MLTEFGKRSLIDNLNETEKIRSCIAAGEDLPNPHEVQRLFGRGSGKKFKKPLVI